MIATTMPIVCPPPGHIEVKHWEELTIGSGITPEIAAANFRSMAGQEVIERLAEEALGQLGGHSNQYVTAPVKRILERYEQVAEGGWWCSGLDPLNGWERMDWGQYKPDTPRQGWRKSPSGDWLPTGKLVKYEQPAQTPPRAIFLEGRGGFDWSSVITGAYPFIVITEGTKKAGALLSYDIPAIALTGVDGWSQPREPGEPRELLDELKLICSPKTHIILAFDADTKESAKQRVESAKRNLADALVSNGVRSRNISLARWDAALGKGIDDVLVKHGFSAWMEIRRNAQSYRDFKAEAVSRIREANADLFRITAPPTVVLNQRYLEGINLPAPGSILGIDSPTETGKTQALKGLKQQFFSLHPEGIFDVPGYRNGLGRQSADRLNSEHLHDLECSQAEHTQLLITHSPSLHYCLDSFHRRAQTILDATSKGKQVCLVLDEADATLRHLLLGGTLGPRRQTIQRLFKQACQAVIQSGGYIVMLEAYLSQLSIDCMSEMTDAPATLIQNSHQPYQWEITAPMPLSQEGHIAPTLMREAAFQDTLKKLVARKNQADDDLWFYGDRPPLPVFFGTDDQKLAEGLEKAAARLGFYVKRLDGNTSEEEWAREFMRSPNTYMDREGVPDLVIVTTTAESGLSIDPGYFDERILYWSHLEFRSAVQMAARSRGDTPLSVYATDFVRALDDGDPANFDADAIFKAWVDNASASGLAVGVHAHFPLEEFDPARESVSGAGEIFHRYAAKYKARANISGAALRSNLLDAFQENGHTLSETTVQIDPLYRGLYRAVFADIKHEHVVEFVNEIPDQTPDWARKVKQSNSATRSNRIKADKILMLESYPGLPVDNETFVEECIFSSGGTPLKAHTLSWLCQHPEIAKRIDLESWKFQMKQSFVWLPSIKHQSLKVIALEECGILVIAGMSHYDEWSPEVDHSYRWALDNAKTLKRLFRLNIKPTQSKIHIINKLLRKIGYDPEVLRKEGPRGDQTKIWVIVNPEDPNRNAVWKAMERKWEKEIAQVEEAESAISEAVEPICISNKHLMQMETTSQPEYPIFSVGQWVRWGTSLGDWVIESIKGDIGYIRQVSGWAMRQVFEAPIAELTAI